jgi:adenosylmethionine-8-amino-7-oxononanoate aminotransferase
LAAATRAEGVLVRALASGVAVSPPLTATTEHFSVIVDALGRALDVVASRA